MKRKRKYYLRKELVAGCFREDTTCGIDKRAPSSETATALCSGNYRVRDGKLLQGN